MASSSGGAADVATASKPVHRRILYGMYLAPTTEPPLQKSRASSAMSWASFHPHGDTAIYDTVARMAQDFSMRHPLIDGQGNFGSIDGDAPAAMRYTRSAWQAGPPAHLGHREVTVDFIPTTTGRRPSRPSAGLFPNLLVNGSSASPWAWPQHPPHNLASVAPWWPSCRTPHLGAGPLQARAGPDFPTAGIILGREGSARPMPRDEAS